MATRNYRAGGFVTDTPSDIKCLQCAPSSGQYDTFSLNGTQYQVPTGKVFYITKIIVNSGGVGGARISYANAAVSNSASPPAGIVTKMQTIGTPAAHTPTEKDVFASIPAEKYPLATAVDGSVDVTIFGYEE